MRITGKGQVTIPAALRRKHGLRARQEIKLMDRPEGVLITKAADGSTAKRVIATLLRGGKIRARTKDWLRLTRS